METEPLLAVDIWSGQRTQCETFDKEGVELYVPGGQLEHPRCAAQVLPRRRARRTHVTPMVHAAAAAAARGLAGATKEYCLRRFAGGYIVRAAATAPPLVPRPGSWWRVMWCVDADRVAPYIELQLQKGIISKNTCTSPSIFKLIMTLFQVSTAR